MSQEELAHQAKIDRTYISALERCVYAASIDVVEKLARVLGVEAADLLKKHGGFLRGCFNSLGRSACTAGVAGGGDRIEVFFGPGEQ